MNSGSSNPSAAPPPVVNQSSTAAAEIVASSIWSRSDSGSNGYAPPSVDQLRTAIGAFHPRAARRASAFGRKVARPRYPECVGWEKELVRWNYELIRP